MAKSMVEGIYNRMVKEERQNLMKNFVRICEGNSVDLSNIDLDEIMLVLKTKKKIGRYLSQRIASLLMYAGYRCNVKSCQEAMINLVNRGIPYELFVAGLSEKDRSDTDLRSKDDFILLIKNKLGLGHEQKLYKAYQDKLIQTITRIYKIDNEKISVDELEKTEWIENASLNDIFEFMKQTKTN